MDGKQFFGGPVAEARERTRDVIDKVTRDRDLPPDHSADIEAVWSTWLTYTGVLLGLGFAQRDICDSTGKLVALMDETEREEGRAHAH